MLKLPNPAVVTLLSILGVALCAPWTLPALADAAPASTAAQNPTTPRLQVGDLVRLRSGGPMLNVKSVLGNWVICTWLDDYGELQSSAFPLAMIDGPVTPSPDDGQRETKGLSEPSARRSSE
jgi:uncharacterized protein YodC (DUF2158 family)